MFEGDIQKEMVSLEDSTFRKPVMHVLEASNSKVWTIVERIPYKENMRLDLFLIHGLGINFALEDCQMQIHASFYQA